MSGRTKQKPSINSQEMEKPAEKNAIHLPLQSNVTAIAEPTKGKPSEYGVTLSGIRGLKSNAKEKLEISSQRKQSRDINIENLETAWKQIIEQLTTDKVFFRNAIGQGSIEFEGYCITVNVFGVAFDFLKNLRLKLLDFFKHYYQNDEINVIVNEKAPTPDKMIEQVLSSKEIFEKMAKKNPLLSKLKDKLGMDFDN